MLNNLAFFALAGLTAGCAAAAMCLRRLVHCALCAAAAFAGLAALYLQLDAAFAGFAQVLVYVGAVAILIVFAILLTSGEEAAPGERQTSPGWPVGLLVAALLLGGLAWAALASPSLRQPAPPAPAPTVKRIGEELMTHYVLPLEMTGVLLTAALLGASVIALRETPENPGEAAKPRKGKKEALTL